MGKSTFSVKFTQLTQKTVKNDQKLTQINDTKLGQNLTTKRWIVGVQERQEKSVSSFGHLNLTQYLIKNDVNTKK